MGFLTETFDVESEADVFDEQLGELVDHPVEQRGLAFGPAVLAGRGEELGDVSDATAIPGAAGADPVRARIG